MKKKISTVLAASVIATNISPAINVFADEVIKEKSKIIEKKVINKAKVTQFNIKDNSNFDAYNEKFRVSRDEIKSISNNGGRYNTSTVLDNAIDGNMSTHWETGKANSADFKNEVVVEFNDVQSIDRIAYATRQDGSKGKGFPTQFEIYSSVTGNDEDMKLVSTGEHSQTGNMMEFKFDTITTKKVKFVFKEAHNNWASASEFWFYKEDKMIDKLNTLFTDSSMSKVSEEFNTTDKLNKLEEEAKQHPFYEDFKEDINNAKLIVEKKQVNYTDAKISKFTEIDSKNISVYNEKFKVGVSKVSNNGRQSQGKTIDRAFDGDINTEWLTGTLNSATFNNEVLVELDELTTLDRIVYSNTRGTNRGFAQEFEIYGSRTSKGETFELVTKGSMNPTQDSMEIKFNSTEFKRLKFVYKKGVDNWACASEFGLYKPDEISNKMDRLFTDSSMSKVSDEFNSLDKIESLENELKEHPMYDVYKEDIEVAKDLLNREVVESTKATVSRFDVYYTDSKDAYNDKFKMNNDNIKSITNNGGQYGSSALKYAIDGDINTHWETGKANSDTFKNEVIFDLKETTVLNRIAYKSRNGNKGFAKEFEIWGSTASKGDNFTKVSEGSHNVTGDLIEIKFNPTKFKRIKFVYKVAHQDMASAGEFMFYKQDELSEKMDRLFTDSGMNRVSDEFDSLEKIEELEKEVKGHPLYEDFKEDIENAKILITQNKIESSIASTKKVDYYGDEKYSELFRIPLSNIKSIKNNAGRYANQVIENAIDGKLDTYWETNKGNNDTFNNEVEVEFKESVTLNRVVYGARQSDRKGFAQEFEIYGSKTSKGDTYELVATGKHDKTTGQVEAKFNPTEFKRLKFKFVKSDQNWASLNEISFYKQDEIYEKVNSMFTNKLMDELKNEFNSKDAIDKLAKEVESHPLKAELDHLIERAYKIINNEMSSSSVKMTVPQFGDVHGHAKKDLLFNFGTNLISTGLVATPGEVFEVYVDAKDGQPMPKIAFTQSQGHYGKWKQEFILNPGYNKITVPNIYDSNWSHKTNPGGAVYIVNPYTEEEQGKAPVVSVEGGRKFPMYNEGDDVNKFLEELKEYKKFMDANPDTAVNIVEYNSPRIMHTGLADAAYQVYVEEGVNVEESIRVWSDITQKMFDFAGLEDNPKAKEHDSTNLRTPIRVMQPFGAAYAAGDHIGIQNHVADDFLRTDKNSINGIIWGTVHEIGHQMDIRPRTWAEVTNNMWSNRMSIDNGKEDNRVNYAGIYNNGATDKEDVEGFDDFDLAGKLSMFWQLEAYHTGYWTSLEKMYRERKPSPKDEQEKREILAKYSSEILGKDLTEYFTRYGITLSDECKKELAKFEKTTDKIWYGNTSVQTYEGSGFTENLDLTVDTVINKEKKTVTLNMSVDKENEDDKLGYEILKNDKVIGYTTGNKFVIEDANVDSNETYQVKAYDRNFGSSDALDVNTFKPSIKTMDKVTLKLGEELNPEKYVKAFSYDGKVLDSVEIKNNVNTNEKGIYTITYSITDAGIKVSKDMEVEVVSDYDYLSDEEWKSVETQWGNPRRNSNIKARVNGDVKEFEKGFGIHANGKITYDLSNKDYDKFEALLGVDASIAAQNNSSITFKIVGDGKTLATTKVLKHADDAAYINVDVKDVKELVIEIHDGGNGNANDHAIIANPKLTTNNAKAKITAENKTYKLGEKVDLMAGVKAIDAEDGDLTSKVEIASNNYVEGKTGRFEVVYRVTDSDKNVVEKKSYITVYEDFVVNKSKFGQFDNLDEYNKEFKLNVSSASNNAGSYNSSVTIGNAIDKNVNTHWETNKPNSDTFKNEVVFDLGESKEISKIAYKPRNGGKGFAKKFEIYTSNEAQGNDFILAGKGEYNGNFNDLVEFKISKTTARRVMFKFIEANENWAAIGEMSFYKEDALADKIANDLFTDNTKSEVSEAYNTLDKLEALRKEAKNHPAVKLFEGDLNKAEEIIRAKFPTLNVEDVTYVKVGSDFDLMNGVIASDKEDGNLTSSVKVDNEKFNINRGGEYTLTYSVTDSNNNVTTKERKVVVYNENSYLTDLDWESAVSGWKSVNKDSAVNIKNKIKLNVNGEVKEFDRGIGAATNAEIVYNLDGKYNYFTTYVGTDKNYDHNSTTIRFKIFADGKEVYTSDVIRKNSEAEFVNLNVAGVKELKLIADDVDKNGLGDFASWGDTKLYSIDNLYTTDLEKAIEEAEKLDLNNYSDETINALEKALTKAKEVLESANQELIDSSTQELNNAMKSLVEANLDQVVNIPDKYLVKSIQAELNKTGDITLGDMRSLTNLTLSGVEKLDGMEYARNLETLVMEYNEVKDLRPLANLKKLKTLNATQQFISGGSLAPSNDKVVVDSKVYNREGKNVAKTVRLVNKFGATVIEKDAEDEFVIDTTDLKAGAYAVHVLFEDEGFDGIMTYMFDIK